jgi:hypothetical protein
MKCNKKDCQNEATNQVSAELRVHSSHTPAVTTPIVYVCDEHSDVTWSDVVTEDAFKRIGDELQAIGRMRPVKKFCNIVIQPIPHASNNNSSLS